MRPATVDEQIPNHENGGTTNAAPLEVAPIGRTKSGEHAYQIFYGGVMLATVSLHGKEVRVERVK
jgi:hypothetical protein